MDFIYYPFIFFMKHKFGGLTYLHYLCSTSKYTAYTMKLIKGEFKEKLELQFAPSIKAGFPSAAEDYLSESLDFNRDLIKHPEATFYAEVDGNSREWHR